MKNNLIISLTIISAIIISGCKDKVDLPVQPLSDYIQVYMPQAVNGPVTYNFSTSDTALPTITYGADYGGLGYPKEDLSVTFGVDATAVDKFNTANNTNYTLLPAKSYKLSDTVAIIKKGEVSTNPFKVTLFTTGGNSPDDISKTYVLPVSIKSASSKVNENLRTSYYIINIVPTLFDRSNWKIIDFSTQEANGEGPNNGRAIFAIDGNINTFWHSQWQGTQSNPPHYITVDLGESKRLLGSKLICRQNVNAGRPQDIQIFVSKNDSDWELAYTGILQNTGETQKIFFEKAVEGRYVKLQINSSYSSNLTHLAEFYLF